jgi:hypothetical protein
MVELRLQGRGRGAVNCAGKHISTSYGFLRGCFPNEHRAGMINCRGRSRPSVLPFTETPHRRLGPV